MEECWKAIKPYSHNNSFYGYGYRRKKRKKSLRVEKRKYLRSIRKHGFDTSETWNLDTTIMKWLAEHVGCFFRLCGNTDDWEMYDIEGNEWKPSFSENNFDDYINGVKDEHFDKCQDAAKLRYESFKKHLKGFLDHGEEDVLKQFRSWIVPRIEYLSKNTDGYPPYDFETMKDWTNALKEMAEAFKKGSYDKRFIDNFFYLWD